MGFQGWSWEGGRGEEVGLSSSGCWRANWIEREFVGYIDLRGAQS